MKLIDKTILFRKLANEELTEDDYKKNIAALPSYSLDDIYAIFVNFGDKAYFKLDDFLPRIYELCRDSLYLKDDIWWIKKYMGTKRIDSSKIVDYVLRRFVDDPSVDMQVADYEIYEEHEVPSDLLRKAQNKIIKTIIARSKDDSRIAENEMVNAITYLLKASKHFSKNFLLNLAKHLGIDIYKRVREETRELGEVETLKKKEKLNVFEVAEILTYNAMTSKEMIDLIRKADDKAKEYMRRFLYKPTDGSIFISDNINSLFILDDELKPMDINYNNINWPNNIIAEQPSIYLSSEPELLAKWRKIFEEFKVIPL